MLAASLACLKSDYYAVVSSGGGGGGQIPARAEPLPLFNVQKIRLFYLAASTVIRWTLS